jgi:tyrosyl-DNA phosphodiesterase 2
LRGRQLRRVFRALRSADDAIVLGDFNTRDSENARITLPYHDVWPMLRPHDDGFTEDTSINLMRYDMKDKHRHVRFDRVLLKSRRWTATEIELLGTEPIAAGLPRVFPSDHFGLECRLTNRNP